MSAEGRLFVGSAVVSSVSVFLFSKSQYGTRLRRTRKLDKELEAEIRAVPQFDVDVAVNACFVDWLDLYRNHSHVERFGQTTEKPQFFVHILPLLVKDEILRKIYVQFVEHYKQIGNDRRASDCQTKANWLNGQVTLNCGYGTHYGVPCDKLLEQLRS